jgi:hypothetical protein
MADAPALWLGLLVAPLVLGFVLALTLLPGMRPLSSNAVGDLTTADAGHIIRAGGEACSYTRESGWGPMAADLGPTTGDVHFVSQTPVGLRFDVKHWEYVQTMADDHLLHFEYCVQVDDGTIPGDYRIPVQITGNRGQTTKTILVRVPPDPSL